MDIKYLIRNCVLNILTTELYNYNWFRRTAIISAYTKHMYSKKLKYFIW
jgi:hypothetical protein